MKFWKYYKMGKFIIEKIQVESTERYCCDCIFKRCDFCEIYRGHIIDDIRKGECKKEVG
jgi:hypothetical protein